MNAPSQVGRHPLAEDLPLAVRAAMSAGQNGWSTPKHPFAGIDSLVMHDGPLGVVSSSMDERETSTMLPSGTSLAATWDPDLVADVARAVGAEARRRGVNVLLGPNLGLPRTPLSGRSFEMYSEDPLLTGTMAAAFTTGVQSQGVGVCLKHLVCNDTETKRAVMSVAVQPKTLREIYLRPFELAIAANPWMVMTAYNKVNGIPCVEHGELLRILKHEWGFDGVVVSDWFATKNTAATANAGIDLEMPGPARFLGPKLLDAVTAGEVSEERVTDMATRFIRLAERAGVLSDSTAPAPVAAVDTATTLRTAAAGGFVLLKNAGNILPLTVSAGDRIAVIGPNAAAPCYQGGTFAKVNLATDVPTPLEALIQHFGADQISYSPGASVDGTTQFTGKNAATPDGQPGVQVEYFTAADPTRPANTEVRPASTFVWFNDIPGIGGPGDGGSIRLTTRLTAQTDGEYSFHVGGTGDATLTVNGSELASWNRPDLSDTMGVVARGDTTAGRIQLHRGEAVDVVAHMVFTPGRVQAVTLGFVAPQPADLLGPAVTLAAESDTVILIVGDNPGSSRESADRETTALSPTQVELIEAVANANERTIVVVNAARPVDMPWADLVPAVLMTWYAGQEFGTALAEVLTGERSPGGRLPITIAARDEDYAGYDVELDDNLSLDYEAIEPGGFGHLQSAGLTPRFGFGHGLTYTTFAVEDPDVAATPDGALATVTVRNTGNRPGRHVVQCYGRGPGENHTRLIGFGAVNLDPGQSSKVEINLPLRAFARWDDKRPGWTIPTGDHTVEIANSVTEPIAQRQLHW